MKGSINKGFGSCQNMQPRGKRDRLKGPHAVHRDRTHRVNEECSSQISYIVLSGLEYLTHCIKDYEVFSSSIYCLNLMSTTIGGGIPNSSEIKTQDRLQFLCRPEIPRSRLQEIEIKYSRFSSLIHSTICSTE
ncbi:uncharacterized protein ACIBXB_016380 [Morphnus guianensis]